MIMKPLLATAYALTLLVFCSSFITVQRPPLEPHELLTITGEIDGSDKFIFTPDGVQWVHLHWIEPKKMTFAGSSWANLRKVPTPWGKYAGLDLAHAIIVERKGRDVSALEHTQDGFILYFDDSPDGSATYSVTIAIPKRAEKP